MIETTEYYDEFLRYYKVAEVQQEECNLGSLCYTKSSVDDDLMKHVHLFDVVERKYAGFINVGADAHINRNLKDVDISKINSYCDWHGLGDFDGNRAFKC